MGNGGALQFVRGFILRCCPPRLKSLIMLVYDDRHNDFASFYATHDLRLSYDEGIFRNATEQVKNWHTCY